MSPGWRVSRTRRFRASQRPPQRSRADPPPGPGGDGATRLPPNGAARELVTGLTEIDRRRHAEHRPSSARRRSCRARPGRRRQQGFGAACAACARSTARRSPRRSSAPGHRVAGIVVIAPVESANEALDRLAARCPLVGDRRRPAPADGPVTVDQDRGRRWPPGTLLDAGHRTVWHVSGPGTGSTALDGSRAGGRRYGGRGVEIAPVSVATGRPASGYQAGRCSPACLRSRRSSRPTTTSRWAC